MNFLVDVSWILYRSYYAYSMMAGEYAPVYGLYKKTYELLSKDGANVYLCFDGFSKGKHINSEYKQQRDHSSVNVYTHLKKAVFNLLKVKGNRLHICYNQDLEADEVMFSLSRLLDGENIIVSGDNDLLQALNDNTKIYRTSWITESVYYSEFNDKFLSVPPKRLPIYRSIVGDSSDNLSGVVPRFPHRLAAYIASESKYDGVFPPTIDSIRALDYQDKDKKWVARLVESYSAFVKNFAIMKLSVYDDIYNEPMSEEGNLPLNCMSFLKSIGDLNGKYIE